MILSDIPEREKLPTQDWWVCMIRPVGAHVWTIATRTYRDSSEKADKECKKIVADGCCAIVVKIPDLPNIYDTDEEPMGKLSTGDYFHPER